MARIWSKFQVAVFDFIADITKGNCVINAVAGSGKTTTILEAAIRALSQFVARFTADRYGNRKRISEVLFLAFNNSIVSEIADKLFKLFGIRNGKDGIDVRTLHSQGRACLAKEYYKIFRTNPPTDKDGANAWVCKTKWLDYISDNALRMSHTSIPEDMLSTFVSNCTDLFNKCRVELVYGGQTIRIQKVADHYGIVCVADEIEVVSELLRNAYKLTADNLRRIDFTDMVVIPAANAGRITSIPKYKLVFVDECQDLNEAQRTLLLASIDKENNGRFVAVGDPRQAINGFAGASCDSFDLLKVLANGNELGLSVCYRCGKAIIDLAQQIVPQIEACEGAGEGEIRHETKLNVKAGDMVLCRKSAPLVRTCLRLIANGIPAQVKGKDIAKGLKELIERQKTNDLDRLYIKLEQEVERLRTKMVEEGVEDVANNPRFLAMQDKVQCIQVLGENAKCVADIVANLDRLFAEDEKVKENKGSFVTLSTIHKAKGLEADNVTILLPEKLPLVWKGQLDWEYEQEMNLKYVAITRAKKVLTFLDLDEVGLAGVEIVK